MARKQYADEDVLNLLRHTELGLASGSSIETASEPTGISDATHYMWQPASLVVLHAKVYGLLDG